MGGKGSGRRRSVGEPGKDTGVAHTNFYVAFQKYRTGSDYRRTVRHLISLGMSQPYIDHLIQTVFEGGWHATNTPIQIISISDDGSGDKGPVQ